MADLATIVATVNKAGKWNLMYRELNNARDLARELGMPGIWQQLNALIEAVVPLLHAAERRASEIQENEG